MVFYWKGVYCECYGMTPHKIVRGVKDVRKAAKGAYVHDLSKRDASIECENTSFSVLITTSVVQLSFVL